MSSNGSYRPASLEVSSSISRSRRQELLSRVPTRLLSRNPSVCLAERHSHKAESHPSSSFQTARRFDDPIGIVSPITSFPNVSGFAFSVRTHRLCTPSALADVIDRISELERSKSTRAEVVERRDVIRHPTQGPDPTSSPRRYCTNERKRVVLTAAAIAEEMVVFFPGNSFSNVN